MLTILNKVILGRWQQRHTGNIFPNSSTSKIFWNKNIFLQLFFFLLLLLNILEKTESLISQEDEGYPKVLEDDERRIINTNKYNHPHPHHNYHHHHRDILNKHSSINFQQNHHNYKQKYHHKKNHKRRSLHLLQQQTERKRGEEESVEIPSARRPRRLFIKKPFWPWP
uniref:Uncharacterized protein n=1 Tax=Meloidogyne incognita TaxID=6306 RepID=A0A914KYD7_MELIC